MPGVEYRVSLSDHQVPRKLDIIDKKTRKVDKGFQKVSKSAKKTGSSLKSMTGNVLNLAKGFGVMFGAMAVGRLVSNSVKIFKEFEKSAKGLEAIFGEKATTEGMKALTDQAKDLGAKTAFTASEILSLDTELAKLGFDPQQIQNSVEGIQNLAAATGIDLATAATIAGSALKIFDLDAREAGRVSDLLAKSTTLTALDMTKLSVAIPLVGTSAKVAGKDIEWTTSRIGLLVDRGIEASTAGTSLRMIFTQLAKKGIGYGEALEMINKSSDKAKTAIELFGARSKDAGIILAENIGWTNNLEDALRSADGFAKQMADTMLDNLAGDITIAGSAWEGFILSMEDGNGVINKAMRGVVRLGTAILQSFTKGNAITRGLKQITDAFKEQFEAIKKLGESLGLVGEKGESLKVVIDVLKGAFNALIAPIKIMVRWNTLMIEGFTVISDWIGGLNEQFEEFGKGLSEFLTPVRKFFVEIFNKLKPIGIFIKNLALSLANFFKGLHERFKIFRAVIDATLAPMKILFKIFQKLRGKSDDLVPSVGEREKEKDTGFGNIFDKNLKILADAQQKRALGSSFKDVVLEEQFKKPSEDLGVSLDGMLPTTTEKGLKREKEIGITGIKAAAPRTFIINLDNLIEEFNINTTSITEGASEGKRIVVESLMEALNDAAIMAGQ